jgi:hypothetical protein
MTKIVIDPALSRKLNGLKEEFEFCDEAGHILGHFLPAVDYNELLTAWMNAKYSDEDLDRRRRESGRSSKEIWQRLRR